MTQQNLIPHLFRNEFSKITAFLCKLMGMEHLAAAEDIASETFLAAINTWTYKGIPPNPEAWLYVVARNKALNQMRREKKYRVISARMKHTENNFFTPEFELTDQLIADSQLQMIFAICHPAISAEAQIALALRVLCGFGIEEIAQAFLSNKLTINKRLTRAREKLRQAAIDLEMPDNKEIHGRLENVLRIIYLLFNEGYYSESGEAIVRQDLCLEAMRLCYLLLEHECTNLPKVNALMALICFHSSRLDARKDCNGTQILYGDQDERLWNKELIARGTYYLHQSAQGNSYHKYHLEASIAYWHTVREEKIGKWENILSLHNQLLALEYSPIAALNRCYALARVEGKVVAIATAEQLRLTNNQFYFMLLGELYSGIDNIAAKLNYENAAKLARSTFEMTNIRNLIEQLAYIR